MPNRKAMTSRRRERIIAQHGARCYCCQAEGVPLDIDHWVPLFLGGSEDDENLRPLCQPCHRKKTAQENRVRGKINRLSGRNKPKRKHKWPSGKIPSRPFAKGTKLA